MGQRAEQFLASFNRIEKWLREAMNNPASMGFSEMVRRLAKRKEWNIAAYEDDLLQMAQLRNAIVHERISSDFVIAEPNEWAVARIETIEKELLRPEKVLPKFAKRVTGFERDIPLQEILKTVDEKRYSQFPLYDKGAFLGLITIRALGLWLAKESRAGEIQLKGRKAEELLLPEFKKINYHFVNGETTVFQVEEMFRNAPTLEAILITKDGDPNGNLLGIIRPRDIYHIEKE